MKAMYIPLFIVLAITLMATMIHAEDYTVGLGVSDYEAHPRIIVGSGLKFEIARVSNEGTLNLTIVPSYIPDYNASESRITIVFTPNTTTLAPQENTVIYAEVTEALEIGTFGGKVEFRTTVVLPPSYTGNPSVPGGSAKVTITIIEAPPVVPVIADSSGGFNVMLFGIPTGVSGLGVIVYIYYRRRRNEKLLRQFLLRNRLPPPPNKAEGKDT